MVKLQEPALDQVFAALADATRRQVVEQLDQGSLTVGELAQSHDMSLPGFMKHLAVLEAAGLIARSKEGRVVRCRLDAAPLQGAALWLTRYERFWNERLDALGRFLYQQEEVHAWPAHPQKKASSRKRPVSPSSASTPSRPTRSGTPGPTRKR